MNGVWTDAQPNTAVAHDRGASADRSVASTVRARDLLAASTLIVCPATLLAFLALRYGFEPPAGARAMLALVVLGAIPGYLIQRYVVRLRGATPFEHLASSLLLGTLITPAAWYILCSLGLSVVFFPALFATAAITPFACGWHRDLGRRLAGLVGPVEALLVVVAFGLAILWSWQLDLVAFEGDRVRILPHNDHMLHTTLIAELARGVPPETVPSVVGVDKWSYHYLPNVWTDMVRRVADLDARTAYFMITLPLRYVLVCLALYLALAGRFGRPAALAGAACVLGFVGHPDGTYLLTNGLLTYLYWNVPASFGLVAVGLILYYASALPDDTLRRRLLIMSFLAALTFWFKANFALAAVPAVGLVAAWKLIPRRDWRCLAVCFVIPVVAVALRTWDSTTADLPSPLAFEPWRFVEYMWWKGNRWLRDLLAETGPGWLAAILACLNAIRLNVNALPDVVRSPTILVLSVLYLFHIGLAAAAIASIRCGFARGGRRMHPVDALLLLIVLSCFVGFVVFPIQPDLVWNVSMHLFALINALLICLMGPVLCALARSAWRRGRVTKVAFALLLAAGLSANGYALVRKTALSPVADVQDVIPYNLYACYGFVDRHTRPDAMLLGPRFEQGLRTAGMLTQRRVVLEWGPGIFERRVDLGPLLENLRAFYAGTTPDRARAILDRYKVTHVIASRDLVAGAGYDPWLHNVYRSGDLCVYRTVKHPRIGSGAQDRSSGKE